MEHHLIQLRKPVLTIFKRVLFQITYEHMCIMYNIYIYVSLYFSLS